MSKVRQTLRIFDILDLRRIVNGMRAFGMGWRVVRQQNLLTYAILPGLLSLLTGAILAAVLLIYLSAVFESWLAQFQIPALHFLAAFGAFVVSGFLFLFSFRLLAALWIVPFLGPLQEKLEVHYSGKTLSHSFADDVKNALRGFWSSLWQALLSLFLLITTIFLGPLQILIIMPFEAYFSARSLFILFVEKEYKIRSERKKKLREFRPEILGLGMSYVVCLFLPAAGVVLAPSIGLAGAAHLYFRDRQPAP